MAPSFSRRVGFAAVVIAGALGLGSGCAHRRASAADASASRTVVAQPTGYDEVWIEQSTVTHPENRTGEAVPPPEDERVGYESLSNGEKVYVVTYVHTYPEPIDTYPRVYWSGRWYYNVNGDFVFWSPAYGWVYYWGPPVPLVACWNAYYPWAVYSWGVGYYGAGWYWGGVGLYGYHAYGASVVDVHHHHHHHYAHAHRPSKGGPTHAPSSGGPTDSPSKGGPTAEPPHRKKPGDPATRERGEASPATADGGARATASKDAAPTRARPDGRPARTRYVTPGGQEVTAVDPSATRRPAAAPTREPRTIGTVQRGPTPPRETASRAPSWDAAPVRAPMSDPFARPSAPSRGPAGDVRAPTNAPSRSYAPSPSPSRSYAPSASPSRSYSPGRSSSPSAPSRSYSPSRSSGPSRSYSPSRSSGPSRSSSPSRSSGGGSSRPSGGGGRRR